MIERRNIANLYPLSPLQEGMLYHALREPDSRAYFEQIDFATGVGLVTDAYAAAWQALARRHDILRTLFAVRKLPQPLQIVLREAPLALTQDDLSGLDAVAADAHIAAWRARDLAAGFDLTAAVPMRLALFRMADGRHRVVWSFHHILLDGWSLALLQADLDALYAAQLAGVDAALAAPAPFSAYIAWLGAHDRAAALAFWQRYLDGVTLPTPVPRRLDLRLAAAPATYSPGEMRHRFGLEAGQALSRLAGAHGVTPNTVVQCLWGLLLGSLNGRHDAVFAATVSGRPSDLPGAERTVGLFINAVPVRVKAAPDESIGALLARVHAAAIAAQASHHCPLAEIQAAHPLGAALFDHILVFENYPQDDAGNADAPAAVSLHEYTHYGVEFQFMPGARPLMRLRFDRGQYEHEAMAQIAVRFEAMLLAACGAPSTLARVLAPPPGAWPAPARVAIAASFTAEPVEQALSWWLAQFACASETVLAPYNQCLQQLADPDSALSRAALPVLMLRLADLARTRLEEQCELLLGLIARRTGAPLVVVLLPVAQSDELELRWEAALRTMPGVILLDLRELGAWGVGDVFDPAADRLGHIPYTEAACEAIGAALARVVLARARAPFKVIAVDCDNTLWGGVAAEAGPAGVRLEAGHLALQRFLIERRAEGFLIALASKNHPDDVWSVFDQNPAMLLQRAHIAATAIGWDAKSTGLRHLAAQLNIGVDSIVFIDDSPLECSEVLANCPDAFTLPLPPDAALYGPWLARCWAFDSVALTDEDRARAGMMQAEATRRKVLGDEGGPCVLAHLGLTVRTGPAQPHQMARLAQLTQRTNQFNLSGRRREPAALAALAAEGMALLAVEVEDRFGAYGLSGLAIVRHTTDVLQVDTLLLSCRVLGRRVEFAVLTALAEMARRLGAGQIEARLVATARNEPLQAFLRQAPWRALGDDIYRCAVDQAMSQPDDVALISEHLFVETAAPSEERPPAAPAAVDVATFPAFPLPLPEPARLRHALQYLPLLAACAGWPAVRPRRPASRAHGGGRAPAAGTEARIAALWSEVLGHDVPDADCTFAELGGHSLHAVRAVARLERAFGCDIGLARFLQLGSIAALAVWLDAREPGIASSAVAIPRAADARDYPLSHHQQRLWLLDGMGAAYNQCAAFRLRGPLDVPALTRALHLVVERHEALRTVFRLVDDAPRQLVTAPDPACFTLVDDSAGMLEPALRERIGRACRIPVDLEHGPLFRAELLPLRQDEHLLAVYLHHLVGDGWSFGVLLDDLARAYAAACSGRAPDWSPAPRYRDFALWTTSAAFEAALAPQRAYWIEQLQSSSPVARIPPDPPVDADLASGGCVTRTLPLPTARMADGGLFPLLAALVALLLHRCGGESSVRLGVPVAGREQPEFEHAVGLFANTLVLALTLDGAAPFSALLAQVRARMTGALEHGAYPFERLVADLQPAREPGRNPLFDVMVVLQNARRPVAGLPGIAVEDIDVDSGLAAFDLVFEFGAGAGDEIVCKLHYRRALYRQASAERLLERLATLLSSVLREPDAPLAAIALVGPDEQRLIEAALHGPARAWPVAHMATLFERQAAATPHALALVAGDAQLDYRTLERRANALAWRLREGGVREGAPVAVLLERDVDWPVALLGVLKAGAVYLPLDPRHPRARQRAMFTRAGAQALVAAPALHHEFEGLALFAPLSAQQEAAGPPPRSGDATGAAYLMFTSGSSGVPKGVRVPHRAFVNMVCDQARGFGLAPDDVVLQLASCAFDASLSELFMAWAGGAAVALADADSARDSGLLGAAIARHRASVITFTPSHLRQIDDADLLGLRCVILAAEAVLGRDARRLARLGIACYNAYGPTECAVCATFGRVGAPPPDGAAVPIGRPLANTSVHILDDALAEAPIGVAGEIVVAGIGVALGYLAPAVPDPFGEMAGGTRCYRTGDLGRRLPDGSIEFFKRRDGQLKIRGHRVEPGEVEAVLASLEGVRAARVGAETDAAGTRLVAYLCGAPQPDAALLARLAGRLPAHMLPGRLVWLEQMPLTPSGKLDQAALATLRPVPPVIDPAASELETLLLAAWRALVPGVVDRDTDFFAAGGNSLMAMGGARRIGAQLGRRVPALQFFVTPTVRSMALALAEAHEDSDVQRHGSGATLLFALPPLPGTEYGYALLARALPETTIYAAPWRDDSPAALVERCVAAWRALDRPAVLIGYSAGGKLALALAHALERADLRVPAVVLLDTWRWDGAASEVRAAIDAGVADDALQGAYRRRLGDFMPEGVLHAPLIHLVAGALEDDMAARVSRDWSALAAGSYTRSVIPGAAHELLGAAHVAASAQALRTLLNAACPPAPPPFPAGRHP